LAAATFIHADKNAGFSPGFFIRPIVLQKTTAAHDTKVSGKTNLQLN
jgi:hypothetical protein